LAAEEELYQQSKGLIEAAGEHERRLRKIEETNEALKAREEDLRAVKDDLEIRVRERTREIEKANSAL
jgi:DNA-binding transcriptional regulator GbsR (MarR family)